MPISNALVERIVADVSSGAADPNHVAMVVGEMIRRQPAVGHYVQGHAKELTLEGSVIVLLHAAVLQRCVEADRGRPLRALDFRALDAATRSPGALDEEPALASYVDSNVTNEDPTLGGARRATARQVLDVVARALLNAT
jgi:hypothetical protein